MLDHLEPVRRHAFLSMFFRYARTSKTLAVGAVVGMAILANASPAAAEVPARSSGIQESPRVPTWPVTPQLALSVFAVTADGYRQEARPGDGAVPRARGTYADGIRDGRLDASFERFPAWQVAGFFGGALIPAAGCLVATVMSRATPARSPSPRGAFSDAYREGYRDGFQEALRERRTNAVFLMGAVGSLTGILVYGIVLLQNVRIVGVPL